MAVVFWGVYVTVSMMIFVKVSYDELHQKQTAREFQQFKLTEACEAQLEVLRNNNN